MNDIIAVPTVEQINLEHQLANSKANEAVQHATNCGLMLLQVKASLNHGEWLPWLKQQQESGAIGFSHSHATRYMKLASNIARAQHLTEAPSIRAALELLSDKEPDAEQADPIPVDIEAERRARQEAEAKAEAERLRREAAEKVLFEEQQRCREFGQESNERRIKIRELTQQIDLLKAQPAPEPVTIEKIVAPDDYETAKATAEKLKADIAAMRKRQDELVQQQVAAKLRERERELDALERQAKQAEIRLQSLNKQIDSYSSIERMTRLQRDQIEKCRSMLAELAANMEGFDRLENDPKTDQLWDALAGMMRNAAIAIDMFCGRAPNTGTHLKVNCD